MLSDGGPRTLPDPRHLGQRIASLRHANGWSQRRLAQAAGVSHGYVALLELGRLPSPGKFRLDAVARALNLRTADALLAPGADVPAAWPEPQPGRADLLQPSSASPAPSSCPSFVGARAAIRATARVRPIPITSSTRRPAARA